MFDFFNSDCCFIFPTGWIVAVIYLCCGIIKYTSRAEISKVQRAGHVESFVLIAQLDVTANAVLPARTPMDSWVMCVTATVTDNHRCRRVQIEIVEGSSTEHGREKEREAKDYQEREHKQTPTKTAGSSLAAGNTRAPKGMIILVRVHLILLFRSLPPLTTASTLLLQAACSKTDC